MDKSRASKSVGKKHVNQLAAALAKEASITVSQANKVLRLFHIDKLVDNANTLHALLQDRENIEALAMGRDEAKGVAQAAAPSSFVLSNMRVGIKAQFAEQGAIA